MRAQVSYGLEKQEHTFDEFQKEAHSSCFVSNPKQTLLIKLSATIAWFHRGTDHTPLLLLDGHLFLRQNSSRTESFMFTVDFTRFLTS